MKLKNFLMPVIISGGVMTLISCNGGHQSLPATNYGEVVSITQQDYEGNKIFHIFEKNGASDSLFEKTLDLGSYASGLDTSYKYAQFNIKNTKEDFNVDLNNFKQFAIAESVEAYAINYKTPGQNHDTDPTQIKRTVSGLVVLPKTEKIRGVILYFHPTEFGKSLVPSCNYKSTTTPDYCNITADKGDSKGFNTFAYLASVYASRGFAVVAPDYLGMGADWDNVHPYVVYPEVNALSGFYMFPALRQLLNEKNIRAKDKLPLMLTGFSEGGGYALKASELAQGKYKDLLSDNNLELKITSPQEGAYSLQDQMNFAFADLSDGLFNCTNKPVGSNFICGESKIIDISINETSPELSLIEMNKDVIKMNSWHVVSAMAAAASKPTLTGYVLASTIYYDFHNLTSAYNFVMNKHFWSNIMIQDSNLNLHNLFNNVGINFKGNQISTGMHNASLEMKNNDGGSYNTHESAYVSYYEGGIFDAATGTLSGLKMSNPAIFPKTATIKGEKVNMGYGRNNSASIFINEKIYTSPQFNQLMKNGSTYNWHTVSPINFINMNYDSMVAVLNFNQAYSCMKYGNSFVSYNSGVSSNMPCNYSAQSNSMIESTIIQNSQLTNEVYLMTPEFSTIFASNSFTRYWMSLKRLQVFADDVQFRAAPMDHNYMYVLSNIIAMCTFENMLKDGKNSGKCPDLNK